MDTKSDDTAMLPGSRQPAGNEVTRGLPRRRIQDVDIDLGKLTVILADRMAAIVPDGFHVEAAEGMLWYSADKGRFPGQAGNYRVGRAGTFVRDNFHAHGRSDEDRMAGVTAQALDELQDYVDEATHDPWPGEGTPPRAYAQVRDRMLHLWYGGPDSDNGAVLACEPIPLAHLQLSPRLPGVCG